MSKTNSLNSSILQKIRSKQDATTIVFRLVALPVLLLIFLLSSNISQGQAIVETFEGPSWTSVALPVSGSLSVCSSAATSTNQTISTWNGAATATTTTASATVGSAWTWGISALTTYSTNFSSCESVVHSLSHAVQMSNNSSYIVSPVVSGGVSTVTFWMGDYNNSGAGVYVGLNTNVTGTNSTWYPTTAINNLNNTTWTGAPYYHFPLNTSNISLAGGHSVIQQFTYTVPASLASVPGQFVIFCDGNGHFDNITLDDIVVTPGITSNAPTITLGANPAVCPSTNAQTANLPYTATSGSPTTYTIAGSSGWTTAGLSNVTNAALPASPIAITVPANIAPGTYTATLTVKNAAAVVSNNYSISVTVNIPPGFSSSPSTTGQTLCLNATPATLSVVATAGSGTITSTSYQWNSSTTGVAGSGTPISGATSSSYTPLTTTAGTLYYNATVTNSNNCSTTSSMSGAIFVAPPAISIQPSGTAQTLYLNGSATPLSVTASPTTGTISYQWYVSTSGVPNSGTIISGATSSTYTPPTTTAGTLYYYVVVSNSLPCSITSAMSGAITVSGLSAAWLLNGNSGTTPGTNFIGTTDNKDVVFKRNGLQVGILSSIATSFGVGALNPAGTGVLNVAFGNNSLAANTTGYQNTATGVNGLSQNTTGYDNVANGVNALQANGGGIFNVGVGYMAGASNQSGSSNTLLGTSAGTSVTSSGNTLVGACAGCGITTGGSNTIIGPVPVGVPLPSTLSNTVILADGSGDYRLYVDNNGHAGFGGFTPSSLPTATLEVKSNVTCASGLKFTNLTNACTPVTTNTNTNALGVDASGNVVLVPGTVISAGTNTTVAGAGTTTSPYVISAATGTSGWSLTGNTSTSSSTNYIGTTDATDFVIKANGGNSNYSNNLGSQITDGSNIAMQIGGTQTGGFNTTGMVTINPNGKSAGYLHIFQIGYPGGFNYIDNSGAWHTAALTTTYGADMGVGPLVASGGPLYIGGTSGNNTIFRNHSANDLVVQGATGDVTIGTATDDPSAILNLSSDTKGFLLPRLATSAIINPATGLMAYDNTANAIEYYNGTAWNSLSGGSGWSLTGNNAPAGSVLGTTNNSSLPFITNGLQRMVIDNQGNVGIGTSSPAYKLDINGNTQMSFGTSGFVFKEFNFGSGATSAIYAKNNADGYTAASAMIETSDNGNFTNINGRLGVSITNNVFSSTPILLTYEQQMGINTTTLDPSAVLNIASTNEGVLLPRLTTSQVNAIGIPANGLLAYDNTLNVFKYYNGTAWVSLLSSSSSGSGTGTTGSTPWLTSGNSGTTPGTNFIGTSDDEDLIFKRNGIQSGILNSSLLATGFGVSALAVNTAGYNTAFGGYTLSQNTTGAYNTATGEDALGHNTTGNYNTAVGLTALAHSLTGTGNTALGAYTMYNANSGSSNVAIGRDGLYYNASGNNNVGIGFQAAYLTSAGNNNTALGYQALYSNTTGSNNIAIGYGAQPADGTSNGQLSIQNIIFGTNNTGTGSTLSTGNIGIGTVAPSQKLEVNGNVQVDNQLFVGVVNPAILSDYALAVNGAAIFTKVRVKLYTEWPDYVFGDNYDLPSLAEVESYIKANKHLPDMPSADEMKKQGIDLGDNQAALLKKVEELTLYIIDQNKQTEEQDQKIETLNTKIADQATQLQELRDEVNELKQLIQKNK